MIAGIMVHHHDGIVDDDSQRHRDSGKGVDVDFQAHKPVQANGNEDIYRKGDGHHDHIAPRPVDKEGKDQQYEQAEQGTDINLVELAADVFRRIVVDLYAYLLREVLPKLIHLVFYIPDHGDKVCIPADSHRKVKGIEPVDAEIA